LDGDDYLTPWGVLGIEKTNNLAEIKKAYARQLKQCHPEDDPVGYQRLREAYERAKRYCQSADDVDFSYEESLSDRADTETSWDEEPYSPDLIPTDNELELHIEDDSDKQITEFLSEVKALYDDYTMRIQPDAWDRLLNTDLMWDLRLKDRIRNEMLYFLQEHHLFPHEVWMRFEDYLQLNAHAESLVYCFSDEFIDYVKSQVDPGLPMRYTRNDGVSASYTDEYLLCREDVYFSIVRNNLVDAEAQLRDAERLSPHDPDLLLIKGILALQSEPYSRVKDIFDAYFESNPPNVLGYLFIVKRLILHQNVDVALKLAEEACRMDSKCSRSYFLAGECSRLLDKLVEAQRFYSQSLNLNSHDLLTRKRLYEIANQLQWKLKNKPWNSSYRKCLAELREQGFPPSKGDSLVFNIKWVVYSILNMLVVISILTTAYRKYSMILFVLLMLLKRFWLKRPIFSFWNTND